MIKCRAFLLDGDCVALSIEEVEQILSYCYRSWVEVGCRGTLELSTVQAGTFRGYVNKNGAPVGQFQTDEGAIYEVKEDSAELVA
jgi:hypothetical protein